MQSRRKYCCTLSSVSPASRKFCWLTPILSFKHFRVFDTSEMSFFVPCSESLTISYSLERNFCELSMSLHFAASEFISRLITSISASISSLMLGKNFCSHNALIDAIVKLSESWFRSFGGIIYLK